MTLLKQQLSFGVLGSGRWGQKIAEILVNMGRTVQVLRVSRKAPNEATRKYRARFERALNVVESQSDIVWCAIPPKDQEVVLEVLIEHHKHAVLEKPWMVDEETTRKLMAYARENQVAVGMHYEFCLLDELEPLSREIDDSKAIFSGSFTTPNPDRLAIPALYNLASHLLAIKQLHFPRSKLGQIVASYNTPASRWIRVEDDRQQIEVDFFDSRQPLVQRFVRRFEQAILECIAFPLGLELDLAIRKDLAQLLGKQN